MGLSQTLPVTSYFKMIDIWMLFTMTVPFLELVFHTSNMMFKKSRATPPCLNKQVGVVPPPPPFVAFWLKPVFLCNSVVALDLKTKEQRCHKESIA